MIDNLFKTTSKGEERPLRIILTQKKAPAGGQYLTGLNLIWINRVALWGKVANHKNSVAQHEFIHALSDYDNLETLPAFLMNDDQKRRFLQAREALVKQYSQKDKVIGDTVICLDGTSKTSTGLRYYAFMNDAEFLTVSLDTFKYAPQDLCKTEAGENLYNLYKEIFKIDPLNDLKPARKTPSLPQSA